MNRIEHKSITKPITTVAILAISLFLLSGCGPGMHRMMRHMEQMHGEHFGEMQRFGERMMPFGPGARNDQGAMPGRGQSEEMQAVSQVFEQSETGILFQLMANDPEDADTITWIQEMLAGQAERITNAEEMVMGMEERMTQRDAQGKQGERMGPSGFARGLSRLGDFMDEVTVEYRALDDGGQIAITSENPEVVDMLHSWLEDDKMTK